MGTLGRLSLPVSPGGVHQETLSDEHHTLKHRTSPIGGGSDSVLDKLTVSGEGGSSSTPFLAVSELPHPTLISAASNVQRTKDVQKMVEKSFQ